MRGSLGCLEGLAAETVVVGQILHCWGWVSGRNREAYLKELSPADLGTNYRRTDEIEANNFIQSFLCTRKGYRHFGGIKEGLHISCILRPAASPPWTCCSTCAYPGGARCCLAVLYQGCGDKAPRHISVLHMPPPPPPQQSTPSRPPISPLSFFLRLHKTCGSLGGGGLECAPRISSVAPSG